MSRVHEQARQEMGARLRLNIATNPLSSPGRCDTNHDWIGGGMLAFQTISLLIACASVDDVSLSG